MRDVDALTEAALSSGDFHELGELFLRRLPVSRRNPGSLLARFADTALIGSVPGEAAGAAAAITAADPPDYGADECDDGQEREQHTEYHP